VPRIRLIASAISQYYRRVLTPKIPGAFALAPLSQQNTCIKENLASGTLLAITPWRFVNVPGNNCTER
jgi:hypothetical protein